MKCPKCGSENVKKDLSVQAYAKGTFFNQYECLDCGYTGTFFPEIKKK